MCNRQQGIRELPPQPNHNPTFLIMTNLLITTGQKSISSEPENNLSTLSTNLEYSNTQQNLTLTLTYVGC
jgi:hypothetical protein